MNIVFILAYKCKIVHTHLGLHTAMSWYLRLNIFNATTYLLYKHFDWIYWNFTEKYPSTEHFTNDTIQNQYFNVNEKFYENWMPLYEYQQFYNGKCMQWILYYKCKTSHG